MNDSIKSPPIIYFKTLKKSLFIFERYWIWEWIWEYDHTQRRIENLIYIPFYLDIFIQ